MDRNFKRSFINPQFMKNIFSSFRDSFFKLNSKYKSNYK